ncbi:hypothetical protein [Hydrocarboniphaga sp.]|uniref:hypothetical protein n=1 Tax=Hydrocarboniphaga sp. TaxID=2033016 RepID=UPI00262AA05A|nr:hypothetical protein [Hydrocarboniphaga sp.]
MSTLLGRSELDAAVPTALSKLELKLKITTRSPNVLSNPTAIPHAEQRQHACKSDAARSHNKLGEGTMLTAVSPELLH